MAYFLEFMERRSRSRLVQFWLTIEGFKDPLEAVGRHSALENTAQSLADDKKLSQSTTIAEDVSFLHQAYFANRKDSDTLDIPVKHQSTIQYFTQLSSDQVTEDIVRQVKVAMFSAQDSVYTQMEEEDWPMFGKSELYRKAVANIERVSSSQAYPVPPPPKRTSTSSTVLPTFPPPPVRQHTAPSLLPSISSPPQRSIPKLINGNFAIPTSKLDPAISMPERSVSGGSTSSGRQTRVSDLREVQSSTPATPSLTRGSSHFDVLMSAGTMKQRNPLFDDNEDEVDDGDSEYIQVQRMEAIQAALNEIIASDDMTASRMSDSQTMSPMLDEMKSPSASVVSLDSRLPANPRKIASRGVDNLKGFDVASPGNSTHGFRHQVIAGRKSLTSLSPTEERPSRVLFDDDPSLAAPTMVEEEDIVENKQEDLIKLAEPGDLKLGTEILRLQTKIQELVKQEHLLETLISQAELTGNQAELRLLHRSQSSIRQETRSCIFQKAQYEQQEEENRLVPGRTRVTIPSHIDTLEEGKQVVRYIVRIEQLDENQEVGLKWDIARRYNDFHDLDKGVRDWASNASDKSAQSEVRKKVAELPSKKLVPVLSGNQLDTRRAGLERYLQVSTLSPFELTSSL
jgi:sorting nexin-25